MARKKAQRKQETALVPHRTPNLSVLLEKAGTGDSAPAVEAYLAAGGSPKVVVEIRGVYGTLQVPLLFAMIANSSHPHRELADSLRLLVAAGADINATYTKDNLTWTVLGCAIDRECCPVLLELLLEHGADPCMRSTNDRTELHIAAQYGLVESCELLLIRAPTLLEARDDGGWSAMTHAANAGQLAVVELLLRNGAAVNVTGGHDKLLQPLMAASLQQHVQVALRLLKAGADVNAAETGGRTALMIAATKNSVTLVQLLLSHGADIAVKDINGHDAFSAAACQGHVSIMELLAQRGSSVNLMDSNTGCTVLMAVIATGHKPAAEWLLQHGAAVDATNLWGGTALHYASEYCDDAAMVDLLLANGADVHIRPRFTWLRRKTMYTVLKC
jgi:uncharacterized protein